MKQSVLFAALGLAALGVHAQEVGRVLSSNPVIEQVAVPRQVCSQMPVVQPQTSGGGGLLGALAGGAIGSTIGGGTGTGAAIVAGTALGAIVGNNIEANNQRYAQSVPQCVTETTYETRQAEFARWFGDSVQVYHPPHDRRHQLNLVGNLELRGVTASARWQLGSGLPFTRPIGFHEAYDYADRLHDVTAGPGDTGLILARPFNGRLPVTHRLDLSLKRDFALAAGTLSVQAGAINAYDRRNMFYYDLYSGRRVDQLPLAPYASLTLRSR